MKVAEIMTPKVALIAANASIVEAAKKMAEGDVGALPVEKDDRLVGMITDRDIVVRAIAKGKAADCKVSEVMTEEIKYCFDDEEVEHIAENMAEQRIRRLPVLNRDKRVVGLISIGDIAAGHPEGDVSGDALRGVVQKGGPHTQSAGR